MASGSAANFDHGDIDETLGFSIEPNPNCPHIREDSFVIHTSFLHRNRTESKAPRRSAFVEKQKCTVCGDASETWACLTCPFSGCSRFKKGHMVEHCNISNPDHADAIVGISLSDLSAWCFVCDAYITHPKLEEVFRELHKEKFRVYPSSILHGATDYAQITLEMENQDGEGAS